MYFHTLIFSYLCSCCIYYTYIFTFLIIHCQLSACSESKRMQANDNQPQHCAISYLHFLRFYYSNISAFLIIYSQLSTCSESKGAGKCQPTHALCNTSISLQSPHSTQTYLLLFLQSTSIQVPFLIYF